MVKAHWLSPETHRFFSNPLKRESQASRYVYYHWDTAQFIKGLVQPDSKVLMIGFQLRSMAAHLPCEKVTLLDWDVHGEAPLPPHVRVIDDLAEINGEPLDYVILPYTLQFLNNIQAFLEDLHQVLGRETRVIILQYNFLWAPVLKLAQKLSLRMPLPDLNWLNIQDVKALLALTNYQDVTSGARCLIPFHIPVITAVVNKYLAPLPWLQWVCQKTYVVGRFLDASEKRENISVSVIVPARNEAGNMAPLLDRIPKMGTRMEIIFVEGHSQDKTREEINRVIAEHPRRGEFILKVFQQGGRGKADAVRLGFSQAEGDVLMILDADLTVQPEDLVYFYRAISRGSAEFLNGSRLIYRMEREAMQVLNLFFNKLFSVWMSWLIGQRLKDTLCGTKAMFRKDYQRVMEHFPTLAAMDPFGDFELLFGAGKLNLKIHDVPVRYKSRTYGKTNIQRFRNGWELLRVCLAGWPQLK